MDSMYSSMRSPLQYDMDIKLRQTVAVTSNSESKDKGLVQESSHVKN